MGLFADGMEILKMINRGANVAVYEKMGDYIGKVQELQTHVDELETANKDLHEQLRFKAKLQRIAGLTYVEGDDEPICSRCAEVDKVAVHIQGQAGHMPICPQCKIYYDEKWSRAEAERIAAARR